MKKLIITLMLILVAISTYALEDQDLQQDQDNVKEVILKPQMKITDMPLAQYNIKLKYLMPYLEHVMVVENPALKKNKTFLGKKNKKVVDFRKDLGINSKTSRYVVGFERKSIKMAGFGDRAFVSGLARDKHYNYVLVKPTFSYYHPDTGEYLGTEILIIGKAKIAHRGDLSLLDIESAKEPIKPGTLVLPSRSLKLSEILNAVATTKKLNGYVLSVIPAVNNAAGNNVVVVSMGARDGVEIGQLLRIKQVDLVMKDPYESKKKYKVQPSMSKGEIVIYDVFDKLSLGIVIQASEEIKLLEHVVSG